MISKKSTTNSGNFIWGRTVKGPIDIFNIARELLLDQNDCDSSHVLKDKSTGEVVYRTKNNEVTV